MKSTLLFFLGVLLAAMLAWAAEADHSISLPGMTGAIKADMSAAQVMTLLKEPKALRLEEMESGDIYGFLDLGYPLNLKFRQNRLSRLNVDDVPQDSKFAVWFEKAVKNAALPDSLHAHKAGGKAEKAYLSDEWRMPDSCRWTMWTTPASKTMSFRIEFHRAIPVRRDSAVRSDSSREPNVTDNPFEIAPQPLPEASPQPEFPDQAVDAGIIKGRVVVKVYVDSTGTVRKWEFVRLDPTGYGFGQEVERVIQHWKFSPAIQRGKKVGVWVAIPFNFKVKGH